MSFVSQAEWFQSRQLRDWIKQLITVNRNVLLVCLFLLSVRMNSYYLHISSDDFIHFFLF
jgi:hypothetical protein